MGHDWDNLLPAMDKPVAIVLQALMFIKMVGEVE